MILAIEQSETSSVFSYHLLRNALNRFKKNVSQLEPSEYEWVCRAATKSHELESLVITSKEAEGLVISESQLDRSIKEIAARYANHEAFLEDLEDNGLDVDGLKSALYRELLFDSVMQRVASKNAEVSELDIRLFYEMHYERFQTPEARTARHILITINPDYPENRPEAAIQRMEAVVEKLAGRVNRFGQFAKRYSECPTAMEGGRLGDVIRGQLYESLDNILFNLQPGALSPIVESDMGLHLLYCEKVKPAKRIPLAKAESKIKPLLRERQRRNCQKAWINRLQQIQQS
jgi:peptidyl-prolyl cis-trans isomerase C